jgi:hypothetical protein
VVQLDDGRQVLVPLEALDRQEDGSYALHLDSATLEARQETGSPVSGRPLVVPVMAEALEIDKRRIETGHVRIRKVVHEREEAIDLPLLSEEVSIERLAIHRFVDEAIPIRYEGNTNDYLPPCRGVGGRETAHAEGRAADHQTPTRNSPTETGDASSRGGDRRASRCRA